MSEARIRLDELLVDRATFDLDDADERELESLMAAEPGVDIEDFELAAAALDLALHEVVEPMPDTVRVRLRRVAEGWPSEAAEAADAVPGHPASSFVTPAWGWWVAAAAAVVALLGWWPTIQESGVTTPLQRRDLLVAAASDLLRIEWGATEDPVARGAGGEVVWSAERQEGYMTIHGLERNDPRAFQYQLWVFDSDRDQRYPVDGGVFDVTSDEVVVPIRATLPVNTVALFAVTVEKPGGVVVSDRSRIVLTAAPTAG